MKKSLPFRTKIAQSFQEIALYLLARLLLLFGIIILIYTFVFVQDDPLSFLSLSGHTIDQWIFYHSLFTTLFSFLFIFIGGILIWAEYKRPKKVSLLILNLSSKGSISISPKLLEQTILQGLSHLELPKISSLEIGAPDSEILVIRCLFNAQPTQVQEALTRNSIEAILRDSIGFEGALTLVIEYLELEKNTLSHNDQSSITT